ncbi:tetratricopeptide repeat protein [Christiangramia aquimixticola]|uniref:tetratricopeptide repeat protein n=1 Tax=Christiangramia aquimixticola TaxID=1697558 RepID=UPI003AA97231
MKNLFYTLFLAVVITGCSNNSSRSKVSAPQDYNKFLAANDTRTTSPYFELWNSKITEDSVQLPSFGVVAGEYNRFFESTGNIQFLKQAEKALKKAVEIANIDKEKYYRSLARNYISQHRFKEAKIYADSASLSGPGITANQHLLFDVYMELGEYEEAESILKQFADPYDFNYMIRAAKWNDFKGDLDRTIMFMEKAKEKAEASKNRELLLWVYSNLGDYHGHAGQINDSYKHYLKTLEIEPTNAYAKKGIAWIIYSHEDNPDEALRILDSILTGHNSPDIHLLKAEIAHYKKDEKLQNSSLQNFWQLMEKEQYGEMYNSYKIELYSAEPQNKLKAQHLAEVEVGNRATPETYQLLALANLNNGNKEKALKIIETQVQDKTYEPSALLTMAKIFKVNRLEERVHPLKEELMEAGYELGPVTFAEIQAL